MSARLTEPFHYPVNRPRNADFPDKVAINLGKAAYCALGVCKPVSKPMSGNGLLILTLEWQKLVETARPPPTL
jgi:hypothetical protein